MPMDSCWVQLSLDMYIYVMNFKSLIIQSDYGLSDIFDNGSILIIFEIVCFK